jgi:hypothetical protein
MEREVRTVGSERNRATDSIVPNIKLVEQQPDTVIGVFMHSMTVYRDCCEDEFVALRRCEIA